MMLDSAVPQGFPEQVPPTKFTVSPLAWCTQAPSSKIWNVTVPVGVGPPPAGFFVTIAWSRTATVAAPARSINESVTSPPRVPSVFTLKMWVLMADWNLFTLSGSQVLVIGLGWLLARLKVAFVGVA